jgi:predicted TIM-barrel fold metal-dependent hydrolase
MHNGAFVFDNVVHMYDNSPANLSVEGGGPRVVESIARSLGTFGEDDARHFRDSKITNDEALSYLFKESDTDMAMAQTVPLFGYWKDGLAPARLQYELKEAAPDRVVFCGGVDPMYQGVQGAVDEMRRQVEEWGAVSMKFYKAHSKGLSWRADDRRVAYPLYEAAQELGLTNVQFHCGLPFGREPIEDLRPNDLQGPAGDFPELQFVIHHLGEPYSDETLSIAARYDNVWLALSAVFVNRWPVTPYEVYHRIGRTLRAVGPERLLWGTEAFVWPNIQSLIEQFAAMKIPVELQDHYGYPELTWDMKKEIFGMNHARLLDLDVSRFTDKQAPRDDA